MHLYNLDLYNKSFKTYITKYFKIDFFFLSFGKVPDKYHKYSGKTNYCLRKYLNKVTV